MSKCTQGLPSGVLVGWYGDDFTGSAAVMEVLTFAGLPSVLFLDVPTQQQLSRFPDVRGIGIASTARSHGPGWMETHLPGSFDWLARLAPPICHYKICSTLDSAPHTGSIGKAIDLAAPRFGGRWVPVLVAAPAIARYQAFGHLFAAAPGGIFRLDRHPVMSHHPVTPMDEADVARHLARQSERSMGLVDLLALETDADSALDLELGKGAEVICLDATTEKQLAEAGRLIWSRRAGAPFVVGSQGIEYALIAHWRASGELEPHDLTASAGAVDRMIAVSGSVSDVTASQLAWAEAHGFAGIPLDAAAVVGGERSAEADAVEQALRALSEGRDPLVFTARGANDPAVCCFREAVETRGQAPEVANRAVGEALGRVLKELLARTGVRRAVISGGDTSGHAARKLSLFAFTALAPTIPGAALLKAHGEDTQVDGLELALKGGQMGSADYFGWIKNGGGARSVKGV